jgi:hypothetical protein
VYNLNYALGVQSRREIKYGGTRTKNVEYYCSSTRISFHESLHLKCYLTSITRKPANGPPIQHILLDVERSLHVSLLKVAIIRLLYVQLFVLHKHFILCTLSVLF